MCVQQFVSFAVEGSAAHDQSIQGNSQAVQICSSINVMAERLFRCKKHRGTKDPTFRRWWPTEIVR